MWFIGPSSLAHYFGILHSRKLQCKSSGQISCQGQWVGWQCFSSIYTGALLLSALTSTHSLDLNVVVLFLIFKGTSGLLPIRSVPVFISTRSAQGFPLHYSLTNTYYFCLFDNSHPTRCEVISPCGLDLHFHDG
uniref:Uncharacterized protein n=1 Tax=Pipistrellus kuhlii TaxID=59472 RepID=A0A7J7XAY2_PIPKU|nr:hypothetical protein mPipKuh1_010597 [Pipistrellus kuhlii]